MFLDYTKAFDRVKHSKIVECLSEIGIDDKDLQIITKNVLGMNCTGENLAWHNRGIPNKERCKAGKCYVTKFI